MNLIIKLANKLIVITVVIININNNNNNNNKFIHKMKGKACT